MKHVAGFPNSAGTLITVFALLRVQSRGSAATSAEQMSTNAVSTPTPSNQPRDYSGARPTVIGFTAVVFAVMLGRGDKTPIWCGDAGIPPNVSVAVTDCS